MAPRNKAPRASGYNPTQQHAFGTIAADQFGNRIAGEWNTMRGGVRPIGSPLNVRAARSPNPAMWSPSEQADAAYEKIQADQRSRESAQSEAMAVAAEASGTPAGIAAAATIRAQAAKKASGGAQPAQGRSGSATNPNYERGDNAMTSQNAPGTPGFAGPNKWTGGSLEQRFADAAGDTRVMKAPDLTLPPRPGPNASPAERQAWMDKVAQINSQAGMKLDQLPQNQPQQARQPSAMQIADNAATQNAGKVAQTAGPTAVDTQYGKAGVRYAQPGETLAAAKPIYETDANGNVVKGADGKPIQNGVGRPDPATPVPTPVQNWQEKLAAARPGLTKPGPENDAFIAAFKKGGSDPSNAMDVANSLYDKNGNFTGGKPSTPAPTTATVAKPVVAPSAPAAPNFTPLASPSEDHVVSPDAPGFEPSKGIVGPVATNFPDDKPLTPAQIQAGKDAAARGPAQGSKSVGDALVHGNLSGAAALAKPYVDTYNPVNVARQGAGMVADAAIDGMRGTGAEGSPIDNALRNARGVDTGGYSGAGGSFDPSTVVPPHDSTIGQMRPAAPVNSLQSGPVTGGPGNSSGPGPTGATDIPRTAYDTAIAAATPGANENMSPSEKFVTILKAETPPPGYQRQQPAQTPATTSQPSASIGQPKTWDQALAANTTPQMHQTHMQSTAAVPGDALSNSVTPFGIPPSDWGSRINSSADGQTASANTSTAASGDDDEDELAKRFRTALQSSPGGSSTRQSPYTPADQYNA